MLTDRFVTHMPQPRKQVLGGIPVMVGPQRTFTVLRMAASLTNHLQAQGYDCAVHSIVASDDDPNKLVVTLDKVVDLGGEYECLPPTSGVRHAD